jgi:hypothetical protein
VTPRARRSSTLALGVSGLLASALLTGCAPNGDVIDADYAQVCKDNKSNQRVEDDKCSEGGRSSGHYGWYFYGMGSSGSTTQRSLPAVGAPLSGGVDTLPPGSTAKSGVSSKGSTAISRGGFGGSAKGNGG